MSWLDMADQLVGWAVEAMVKTAIAVAVLKVVGVL